jgi:GT2 family glycosyltransferase
MGEHPVTLKRPEGSAAGQRAPEITAAICTYNRYDVLPDAIASLANQALDPDSLEILIIDNSADRAGQSDYWAAHEIPTNARLLVDTTAGLSRARNTALRASRASVIAFLDDDAVAMPEWCPSLVDSFRTHPDAGIVGGPVEPIWPEKSPSWLHKWQRGFLTIVDHGEAFRVLQEDEWLAGTNIAFRNSALQAVGGFHEGLGRTGSSLLSNEELAVSRKVREAGFVAYYEPKARVMHRVHSNRTTQQWLRQRVCWQAVSDLLANATHPESARCWSELAQYQSKLPVEMRGVRGLFLDMQEPDDFYQQCRALEALMHLALNRARDPECE